MPQTMSVLPDSFALAAPQYIDARVLAANTAETVTVPTGRNIVVFSGTADFYVRYNGGAAAVPAADVTDGNGSELNPTVRSVTPGGTFSIIAPATTVVTMAFYKQ